MPVLNSRQLEKLIDTRPDTFPAETPCAVCGQPWLAHNGALCPICALCHKHGLEHQPLVGVPVEVVQIRQGSDRVWTLCRGGTTEFLPQLDAGGLFDGD